MKTRDTLTPEQIGKAGELKLDELCNETSVKCVALVPDLLGVDRHLEFPSAPSSEFVSLDTRPPPLSCYVQVKSKSPKQRSWNMSLSVAERLAKSGKPAFIALFEVGDKAKVRRGYLAHLRGALLARILERLRDADSKGHGDLNRRTISLTPEDAVEFQLDGDAFAQALRLAIGESMSAYAETKNHELLTLGFDSDRFTAVINCGGIDFDALVDAHMGERSIPIEGMEFSERRFNISRPAAPGTLMGGELSIEATPIDGYELTITGEGSTNELRLSCSVLYPQVPGLPRDKLKFRLIASLVTFKFGGSRLTYTAKLNDDVERPLASWRHELSVALLLLTDKCSLTLTRVEDGKEAHLGTTEPPSDTDIGEFRYLLSLVDAAIWLLEEANVPERPMRLDALLANPSELKRAYAVMSQAPGLTRIRFKSETATNDVDNCDFLYIGAYVVGDDWFAYCARTVMHRQGSSVEWESGLLTPIMSEKLKSPVVESYHAFHERMQRITGVRNVLAHDLVEDEANELGRLEKV
jgi:hypothetical protein